MSALVRYAFAAILAAGLTLASTVYAQQPDGRNASPPGDAEMSISQEPFGTTPEGQQTTLFTLTNGRGMVVKLTDFGAIVVSVEVPDREGNRENITLGFDSLEGYLQRHPYFGATVGRYANRIAQGRFTLDEKSYQLAVNNGPNHLHGGIKGFDRYVWQAEPVRGQDQVGVRFERTSVDGEENYPGNLQASVTYSLTDDNRLKMEYTATTDAPTIVNLTNHCYWNLAGEDSPGILDHELTLACNRYLEVDATLIPTGQIKTVESTPLDFRQPHRIGERIDALRPTAGGYDHCLVLAQVGSPDELQFAARVHDPGSGRVMEIWTSEPAIQFYSGNFLDGAPANGGYPQHAALCLETQHYPDSPNHPDFPSVRLDPGQTYRHVTVHRFSNQQ
jgi:aldose 1-epimerase